MTCKSSQRVSQSVGAGDDSATSVSAFTWKKTDDDIQFFPNFTILEYLKIENLKKN